MYTLSCTHAVTLRLARGYYFASPPLGRYQIILLGDRRTRVRAACTEPLRSRNRRP